MADHPSNRSPSSASTSARAHSTSLVSVTDRQARIASPPPIGTEDDNVDMANESEITQLLRDCAHGGVPAVGNCYGLDLLVDDSIEA